MGHDRRESTADREEILRAIRPHHRAIAIAAALAGASVLFEILLIALIAALSARVLEAKGSLPLIGHASSGRLVILAGVFAFVKLVIDYIYARSFAAVLFRYEANLRRRIADLQAQCSWATIEDSPTGSFHALLWTSVPRSREGINHLLTLITSLTSLVLMLAATVATARLMVLPAVGGLVVIGLAFRPLIRATRDASRLLRSTYATYSRELNESVTMSREARILGVQSELASRLGDAGESAASSVGRQTFYSIVMSKGYSNALYIGIIISLGIILNAGFENPAQLAAVALLLYRSMSYGQGLQSAFQNIAASAPFIADVNYWIDELERNPESKLDAKSVAAFERLDFVGTELNYPNGHVGVRDLSTTIQRGDSIALVGRSGSGKSSFVSLLLALREHTGGDVLVNNTPLQLVDRRSWRAHLAFVPQESVLFETSILENVRCWRAIDEARVRAALRQANIYEEVMAMDAGLETDVGEGGRRLSGGQRQRICLARALAGDPELLVLDEPTSALDPQSERAVRDSLKHLKGTMTMVIIAHRMTTISMCDRVLVLEDGHLRHDGPPEVVANRSDYFARALELSDGG